MPANGGTPIETGNSTPVSTPSVGSIAMNPPPRSLPRVIPPAAPAAPNWTPTAVRKD